MAFEEKTCPYCGFAHCEAEWVDVGVGNIQYTPYSCTDCGAFEIGPYDKVTPTELEKEHGWYAPKRAELPKTVSAINGRLISASTALALYAKGLVSQVPFHLTIADDEIAETLGGALSL